jgi:hypothetical protein
MAMDALVSFDHLQISDLFVPHTTGKKLLVLQQLFEIISWCAMCKGCWWILLAFTEFVCRQLLPVDSNDYFCLFGFSTRRIRLNPAKSGVIQKGSYDSLPCIHCRQWKSPGLIKPQGPCRARYLCQPLSVNRSLKNCFGIKMVSYPT